MDFEQLSMQIQPRQTTLQFSGSVVGTPPTVRSNVTGSLLDYSYSFDIERVAEQGQKASINGSTFSDLLTQSFVWYQVEFDFHNLAWIRPTIQDHISALSGAIGKTIVYRGRTFYPKTNINLAYRKGFFQLYEVHSGSFGELLNNLFGWSDSVPNMVFNLHIIGNTIYIIQRGYETNNLTPANWDGLPTLTHTIRHTEWSNSSSQTVVPKQISSSDNTENNTPFSGDITWGHITYRYEDGYLKLERNGTTDTTYTYTSYGSDKYLSLKETLDIDNNVYTKTEYSYETQGNQLYLHEEKTTVYDGQDDTGTMVESRLTRHTPVNAGGWYGTTMYDTTDGIEEEVSSSLSLGTPGQKMTQYTINESQDALKPSNSQRQLVVPLNGVAKARQSYPVADTNTLQAIANCLDSYENKEEVTLSGEIVGGTHIYNYDDTIVYNGNTYYLVSNNVTKTFDKVRQNIVAVRYILS